LECNSSLIVCFILKNISKTNQLDYKSDDQHDKIPIFIFQTNTAYPAFDFKPQKNLQEFKEY